jgi:hypothetical protein
LLVRYAPCGEVSAETAFRQAIGLAAQQGALLWELRASVDLAKLQLARGEPVRARETLAPVYARFSEASTAPIFNRLLRC